MMIEAKNDIRVEGLNFLVTGGAGFIGSNLVENLLEKGAHVRVLDNFSTGRKENLQGYENAIELVEGDIRNYDLVYRSAKDIDVIFHLAALPSVQRSIIDPITSNEVNISGTLNILKAAVDQRVKRVVFASSSSVYGDTECLPKHEGLVPNPLSPYAITKLAGEKYCSVFNQLYGVETIVLRYFNVFGPKQDPNSQYSAVIPKFITTVLKGESPVIYGSGEQTRDFTYVKNVVNANILAALGSYPAQSIMNCACNQSISLNALFKLIVDIIKKDVAPLYMSHRKGDIMHSLADISLIKKYLRYEVEVDFYEGMMRTIESIRCSKVSW